MINKNILQKKTIPPHYSYKKQNFLVFTRKMEYIECTSFIEIYGLLLA